MIAFGGVICAAAYIDELNSKLFGRDVDGGVKKRLVCQPHPDSNLQRSPAAAGVVYSAVDYVSIFDFWCGRAVPPAGKCNSTITLNTAAKKHHTEINHVA